MLASSSRAAANIRWVDTSHNAIAFDMHKCINCQACVRACKNVAGQSVLKSVKINEGKKKGVVQTVTGKLLAETNCIGCGQCTLVCPTQAIHEKDALKQMNNIFKNKGDRILVCQIAPAIRINMAEGLGVPVGTVSTGKVVTALKRLGFDYVFDTNFGADLTIVEEATELLQRLNDPKAVLPMFTSCCPAWVNYVEKSYPQWMPHLSTCRSPIGMLSAVIKNVFPKHIGVDPKRIFSVGIMPCTAKKDEAAREQLMTKSGLHETDLDITSRELAKMIKAAKINFKELLDTELDSPYAMATGGGAIFCATGGVMEAAVRSAYKFATGKELAPIEFVQVRGAEKGIKVGTVDINGREIKVAVAQGVKNAMSLIKKIEEGQDDVKGVVFCEVMACPGGCVGGGGSPRAKTKAAMNKRLDATYRIDRASKYRTPQDNTQLQDLYNAYLGGKFGHGLAHEYFHTHFKPQPIGAKKN